MTMKLRMLLPAAGLAVALVATVEAADVTGKWVAQVPGRDGETRETTFTFKVEGDKLTGTMTGRMGEVPLADGKVQGDDISFTTTLNFQGNDVKLDYKGKVAGDEIKMTRQRQGGDRTTEFTAKRAK
jgi:hypothetical protein